MTAPVLSLFNQAGRVPSRFPGNLWVSAFGKRIFCASVAQLRQTLWHRSALDVFWERVRVARTILFGRVAVSATLIYFWDGDTPSLPNNSNLQHLLKPRQVARAVGRDKMLACTLLSTYIDSDI
jgi:hypothetical protein